MSREHFKKEDELLKQITKTVPLRIDAIMAGVEALNTSEVGLTRPQCFSLAATDLFVEKAQAVLSRRGDELKWLGIVTHIVSLMILAAAAVLAYIQIHGTKEIKALPTPVLILRIYQGTAVTAFFLIAVKMLLGLGRSFFHEAFKLYERRHALRFGRLYVYLKRGTVSLESMEEAFQWNREVRTSFLDLKPDMMTETLFHRLIDAFVHLSPKEMAAWLKRLAGRGKKGQTTEK